jgi:hypothetical protein
VAEERQRTEVSRSAALEETIVGQPADDVLEAIHELSARVGGLQAELNALRAQSRALPETGAESPGWDGRDDLGRETFAWVRDLETPRSRATPVPWFLLEITFLVAVAVGLAIADLDWKAIVAAMAGAWLLVAIAEWTAARAARRRAESSYAPVAVYEGLASDPSWFAPPSERTVLDLGEDDTGTRLPPPSED